MFWVQGLQGPFYKATRAACCNRLPSQVPVPLLRKCGQENFDVLVPAMPAKPHRAALASILEKQAFPESDDEELLEKEEGAHAGVFSDAEAEREAAKVDDSQDGAGAASSERPESGLVEPDLVEPGVKEELQRIKQEKQLESTQALAFVWKLERATL